MKKWKLVAVILVLSVIIFIVISSRYNLFPVISTTDNSTSVNQSKKITLSPPVSQNQHPLVTENPVPTKKSNSPVPDKVVTINDYAIHDSIQISLGSRKDDIISILDKNLIKYEKTSESITSDGIQIRFDDSGIANYILLDGALWSTSKGLTVEQSLPYMKQLYGDNYIWEVFNHRGRYDEYIYSFGKDKLEILTTEANLSKIYKIYLYHEDYKGFPQEQSMDQVLIAEDSDYFALSMTKKEITDYHNGEHKIIVNDMDNTLNLYDSSGQILMQGELSDEELVTCLNTSSDNVSTGRGLKIGDKKDKMEELYGTIYHSNEIVQGERIIYEFQHSNIIFTLKDDTISNIVINQR